MVSVWLLFLCYNRPNFFVGAVIVNLKYSSGLSGFIGNRCKISLIKDYCSLSVILLSVINYSDLHICFVWSNTDHS